MTHAAAHKRSVGSCFFLEVIVSFLVFSDRLDVVRVLS